MHELDTYCYTLIHSFRLIICMACFISVITMYVFRGPLVRKHNRIALLLRIMIVVDDNDASHFSRHLLRSTASSSLIVDCAPGLLLSGRQLNNAPIVYTGLTQLTCMC
jgi:hypothetical protein